LSVRPSNLKITQFSHQFYDTVDDEEHARSIMKRRICSSFHDIKDHFRIHEDMRNVFYSIEDALNHNTREGLASSTLSLCHSLMSYAEIVQRHKKRMFSGSFLFYSTCISGHYFPLHHNNSFLENRFNPNQSLAGLQKEVNDIRQLLLDMRRSSKDLVGMKLTDLEDHGEGTDSSLRGRLELTRELLSRVGYTIPLDENIT